MTETRVQVTQGTFISNIVLVKYLVDKEELKIEYCLIHAMLDDLFTKTISGTAIPKF